MTIHWSFLTFVSTFARRVVRAARAGSAAPRARLLGRRAAGRRELRHPPEIFELGSQHPDGAAGADGGAGHRLPLLFHALERFVLVHTAHEDATAHRHPRVGKLAALALIGHSFLDGVGIGVAFQVSPSVGLTVAIAVIAHDFCDGLQHRRADADPRQQQPQLGRNARARRAGAHRRRVDRVFALAPGGLPRAEPRRLRRLPALHRHVGHLAARRTAQRPKAALRLIRTTVLGTAFIYVVVRAS